MASEMSSLTDVSFNFPTLAEALSVLSLNAGFNSAIVVMGTTFLGVSAGIVGSFAVLRKRALMGDTLAHSALPGVCLAFLLAVFLGIEERNSLLLLLGGAFTGVLGVIIVQFLVRKTKLSSDASMGIVLSVFFGVGVVLLSIIQNLESGSAGGLNSYIYGQTAAMSRDDAILLFCVGLFAVTFCVLFLKEFRLVCFDEEFATTQGFRVNFIDLAMMGLVVLVTVVGLQTVGVILIVALLIIPAVSARFWTEKLTTMLWLSALFGGLSGYIGSSLSSLFPRMPAGSVIVLSAGVLFTISFLFAPCRGVVADIIKRRRFNKSLKYGN